MFWLLRGEGERGYFLNKVEKKHKLFKIFNQLGYKRRVFDVDASSGAASIAADTVIFHHGRVKAVASNQIADGISFVKQQKCHLRPYRRPYCL